MTTLPDDRAVSGPGSRLWNGLRGAARGVVRALGARFASSLTRRIVMLNLAGLVALLLGFLYINQFREGLIDARVQSLLTQGEIIAAAIAASATVETDSVAIDPDKLLQLQAGESSGIIEDPGSWLQFSINPEQVSPLLRRLVTPTGTRARVYDSDGILVVDTRNLYWRGDVFRRELPPLTREDLPILERTWNLLRRQFTSTEVTRQDETETAFGHNVPEVARALQGTARSVVRVNAAGETTVAVAVPVQRQRSVRGALLLSTQGGDIDAIIAKERLAILQVFGVSALVMTLLSVLLANGIADPIRRLSEGAERVRRRVKARVEIPDFTNRSDEIGALSGSLRDMTTALYGRIDAIESFAADVAHELKNPLTSLRSAVETLPLARNEQSRDRLLGVIRHDVRRLDRLISDISNASRLDAELARIGTEPVDLAKLLTAVVSQQNELSRDGQAPIRLSIRPGARGKDSYLVLGDDGRLGQVFVNLFDNARSFSPEGGEVRVELRLDGGTVVATVDDDGPGIPPHALERIFERFYTDRPEEQGFGQNSGLGLSISRQIVEAYSGRIAAENRLGPPGEDGEPTRAGARFVVSLPSAFAGTVGPRG